MKYNVLIPAGIFFILLASVLVFAQDEVESEIGEVVIFTTDGRLCRGFVDDDGCANVECNTGHSAKKCAVSPDTTCGVEIDNETPMCIRLFCGDNSSTQCIEEIIEPNVEVIVPSQVGEVSIFSTTDGKSCKAWLADSCAYAECYDGDTKLGETDVICSTDALPDDAPEGLVAKQCIVSTDEDGNPCVKYSCSGFSSASSRAYKNACLDQYVEEERTETKVVFLKNKTFVLNNITTMETIFQRIMLNTNSLAEYYNSIGDAANHQKFSSVSDSASNILESLSDLRPIIENIEDLGNMSGEEQELILDIGTIIKQEFDSLNELLGGAS